MISKFQKIECQTFHSEPTMVGQITNIKKQDCPNNL